MKAKSNPQQFVYPKAGEEFGVEWEPHFRASPIIEAGPIAHEVEEELQDAS